MERIWWGPYVDFDRTDQGAIAADLTSAVCIATSGWGCPASAAILASAAFYIALYGFCPNKLRVYPNALFGYPMRWVS